MRSFPLFVPGRRCALEKLTLKDIRGPKLYVQFRDDLRKKVIELKRPRRIDVGDRVTLVFENRATLIFQVEEMLRAESITEPARIQDELDVYNELLPEAGQLSATLFLGITDESIIKQELHKFIGLDEPVYLVIGGERVRASFEPGRQDEERISAVQYIRFALTPAQVAAFVGTAPLSLVIDHPNYQREQVLGEDTRKSLAADLQG